MTPQRGAGVVLALVALSGCVTPPPPSAPSALATIELTSPAGDAPARIVLRAPHPVRALHFATELGGYRARDWRLADSGFRWVAEGEGERLERSDGQPFSEIAFDVEQRYRSLIKSYGPFSPFSDGGLLVYSGHFHACLALPCTGEDAAAMSIFAPGRAIRVRGAAGRERLNWVSRGEGANIYIGNRAPQAENGMSAIIDPALPEQLRDQLARALPASVAHFGQSYGPLSFQPQLFVSIDARGRGDGQESTQGGTLPQQIFIHFDGAQARQRAAQGDPGWLDWFFAHEVAHMFQRDRSNDRIGDNAHAWMHEGGADAMAALALRAQGMDAYVDKRLRETAAACRAGLAKGALATASARGDFELHYACGPIAALAIDRDLGARGGGLDSFNRRWFAQLASGRAGPEGWFAAARSSGVSAPTLALLADFTGADAAKALTALDRLAPDTSGTSDRGQ